MISLSRFLASCILCLCGHLFAGEPIPSARAAEAPAIFLVGDSTVRTAQEGKAGWGDALTPWLAPSPPRVENCAHGGTSSRSFRELGYWDRTLAALRPGDLVLIQFGHNDEGSPQKGKAPLKGAGPDTLQYQDAKGRKRTVHSYGWYIGRMVEEARAKGAVPVVLTPVPRAVWDGQKLASEKQPPFAWAKDAAKMAGAPLVDLHQLVQEHYEETGMARVNKNYFARGDETHTTREGASAIARILAKALRESTDPQVRKICGGG